jgi:SRSO17 transposase
MWPMAERVGADYQQIQQFVSSSTWPVGPVRARIAALAQELIEPVAWVVDDTGFPKDGKHSPGVARQYSGSLGACHANCVSRRCTKIDWLDCWSEGTPSDSEHIVSWSG